MAAEASTHIQWTMKLSDAGLIVETLARAADSHEGSADYLESERYAEDQRERYMNAPREEGERRRRADWKLSDADRARIVDYRAKAERLRKLVQS